jgi:flagellar motility protein MotE (MotC chaperone)
LATRGRKRGFCLIGSTQRISKLHKDVCAELNNYAVGRTSLDIDMKRSADILGFSTKQDMLSLRELDDGEFYVFGPAISKKIEKEKVAKSKTTHPKQGMDIKQQIIPPTDKVKQIISKLNDLPKEQEKELKDVNDYKLRIKQLESELKKKPKEVIKEEKVIEVTDKVALEKAYERGAKDIEKKYESILSSIKLNSISVEKALRKLLSDGAKILESKSFSITADKPPIVIPEFSSSKKLINKPKEIENTFKSNKLVSKQLPISNESVTEEYSNGDKITGGALRILKASASFYPNVITKARAGAIAGLSYRSGTFGTYLSILKRNNFIEINGNEIIITQDGISFVGEVDPIPSDSESLINMWCNIVKGGASRMLRVLADNYPNSVTKEELGTQTGLSHFSGTFGTYLSTLKRNGLIEVNGSELKIAEEFFK